MKSLEVAVIVVLANLLYAGGSHGSLLSAIAGCKQYSSNAGYDDALLYIPTGNLQNVGHRSDSKVFKFGVLGPNDGHLRYGETLFPYGKSVIEIVIGGWDNTKSVARQQLRLTKTLFTNNQLGERQTPGILSPYHPTIFVLEVFNNGVVQVSIDGHAHPFLTFFDNTRTPANYMAFTKWNRDLIFFYDCPLTP
uniref:Farnesoic acid O-methyl transferase domain-containing protein n=1 Tax=Anopheles dirus TaxID=7168 RepID=A0A182NJZ4_9DIPT